MTAAHEAAPAVHERLDHVGSVRVVVVTYSPGDHLTRFLDSLVDATQQPYEVVLADNGSTDGAPEQAAASGAARLVPTGGNLGYGTAANVGARDATTDWLIVANPDIVWDRGALDTLLAASSRWPGAGVLGPAIRTEAGKLYPSARAFPSLRRGIAHALLGWWWPRNRWTAAYRQEMSDPVEGLTGWLSGSCMLVRRSAFEAVGGFDESYFMFCEDMDLCDRLARAGWSCVYVPSAVVTHVGGHSWRRAPRRMLYHHHRSTYRFLSRKYAGLGFLPVRIALAAGLAGRFLLSLVVRGVAEGAAPARSADVLPATMPPTSSGER